MGWNVAKHCECNTLDWWISRDNVRNVERTADAFERSGQARHWQGLDGIRVKQLSSGEGRRPLRQSAKIVAVGENKRGTRVWNVKPMCTPPHRIGEEAMLIWGWKLTQNWLRILRDVTFPVRFVSLQSLLFHKSPLSISTHNQSSRWLVCSEFLICVVVSSTPPSFSSTLARANRKCVREKVDCRHVVSTTGIFDAHLFVRALSQIFADNRRQLATTSDCKWGLTSSLRFRRVGGTSNSKMRMLWTPPLPPSLH